MNLALLIARLALAAVFAAAALGKLADLDGSRRTVERFGFSPRLARPAGLLLPLTELAIAFGLLFVDTARWAATAAVALLLAFSVAIGRVLVRGEAPDCNCFGSLGSAPVGRGTLVRNGALIAVAGFAVVAGWNGAGTSAFAWVGENTGLAVVAGVFAVAVGLQAALSWQLFKQNGRLLARVTDLEEAAGSGGAAARRPRRRRARSGFRAARSRRTRSSVSTTCLRPAVGCCCSSPIPVVGTARRCFPPWRRRRRTCRGCRSR